VATGAVLAAPVQLTLQTGENRVTVKFRKRE
jgi:hypothetical protein